MADPEVCAAQRRRDAPQPMIGLRLIQNQIAGEDQLHAVA